MLFRGNKLMRIIKTQHGIALLLVLWILTILMVVALSFSVMSRTETYSTIAFKETSEKKFIAEAGVQRALMELFYRSQNQHQTQILEGKEVWRTDYTPYIGAIGDGFYVARVINEAGKIDINLLNDSSGIILKNLLRNSGVSEEDADIIVDSILDWKDSGDSDAHRLHGVESEYYMSLPNPYKAKNANFDTIEELILVKGMTPDILYGNAEKKGIINFLTVHSKSAQININAAPKEVLVSIPGITEEAADEIIKFRENKKITGLNEIQGFLGSNYTEAARFIGLHEPNMFSIYSAGYKNNGKAGYAVAAVVSPEPPNKHKFLYYKTIMSIGPWQPE